MLFTLILCSFVVVNNAVQLSLQPIFNHSKGNFMSQILAHKNNAESDQSLINLIGKLDPAQISNVITLVEELLSNSQADLDRITSDSVNADAAYVVAVDSHNAAVVAHADGVIAAKKALDDGIIVLRKTHDDTVAALQAVVDSTLAEKDIREATKTTANNILNQEKNRLDTEISSLTEVISLLRGVRDINVPVNGLYSWFKPSSANAVWSSSIGNFKGAASGSQVPTVVTEAGNGASVPITYLMGTTSSSYNFGAVVPDTFTICSMTRYTGDKRGRILQGYKNNWLHGHWSARAGMSYTEGWNTVYSGAGVTPNTDWLITCASSDGSQAIYVNGVAQTDPASGSRDAPLDGLVINPVGGRIGANEYSDWGVAEIITWNRVLTVDEIIQVSRFMRKEISA